MPLTTIEKKANLEKAGNFGPRCPEGENSRFVQIFLAQNHPKFSNF
jgi:hypothetical protein